MNRDIISKQLDDELTKVGFHSAIANYLLDEQGDPQQIRSVSAVHSIEWIGNHLEFAQQMTLLTHRVDEKENLEFMPSAVDNLPKPDWKNQTTIIASILSPDYVPPSLLAVVMPDWVNNPSSEFWDKDGRATLCAINYLPIDSQCRMVLVNFGTSCLYLLIGNNILMGLRGFLDLCDIGTLRLRDSDGSHLKKAVHKSEFQRVFNISDEQMKYSSRCLQSKVEYIPAVLKGETREHAANRIRSALLNSRL